MAKGEAYGYLKKCIPCILLRRTRILPLMPHTLYMLLSAAATGTFYRAQMCYFGIAETPAALIPKLKAFWPKHVTRMC
jgi:hypothetical protein